MRILTALIIGMNVLGAQTPVMTNSATSETVGTDQTDVRVEEKFIQLHAVRTSSVARDLVMPFTFGIFIPRITGVIQKQHFSLSLSNIPMNWKNAKGDYAPLGDSLQATFLHGAAGSFGYIHMRNAGYSRRISTLGAFTVGFGIELSQSCEEGHAPSFGDIARTTLYGTILGEMQFAIYIWANDNNHRVIAFLVNPGRVVFGNGVVGVKFTF